MNHTGYDRKIEPRCPVAVKMGQSAVYAPEHVKWGTVTCDACGDNFFIGPHRIYGSRINAQEGAKKFETLLAEDHRVNRPHADSYEIPES